MHICINMFSFVSFWLYFYFVSALFLQQPGNRYGFIFEYDCLYFFFNYDLYDIYNSESIVKDSLQKEWHLEKYIIYSTVLWFKHVCKIDIKMWRAKHYDVNRHDIYYFFGYWHNYVFLCNNDIFWHVTRQLDCVSTNSELKCCPSSSFLGTLFLGSKKFSCTWPCEVDKRHKIG